MLFARLCQNTMVCECGGLKNSTNRLSQELASGTQKAVPWKRFLLLARECISTEYLPDAHLSYLAEPSSMRDNQCYTLLQFWFERQNAGHSPVFRFQKYLVKGGLAEAIPRKLVEAEADDEAEDDGPIGPKPKSQRKRRGVRSAKGKEKAHSSDQSSDSSDSDVILPKHKGQQKGQPVISAKRKEPAHLSDESSSDASSSEDQIRQVTIEDYVLDDLDFTPHDDPSAPSSSTPRQKRPICGIQKHPEAPSLPITTSQVALPIAGPSQPSTAQLGTKQLPTSTPTAIPPLTLERPALVIPARPAPSTPERPAPKDLDDDSDFVEESLDLSLLQPELQAIALDMKNKPPVVHKFLSKAFHPLQVNPSTPATSGQAALIPEGDNSRDTKRSRSDSIDPIPSSPTKKTRFLPSHSRSYDGDSQAVDLSTEKGLENQGSIGGDTQDLIGITEEHKLPHTAITEAKGKGKVKKHLAKVVVPSNTPIPRLTRSKALSNKMTTRASSTSRPK
jgi:hypothetical protein